MFRIAGHEHRSGRIGRRHRPQLRHQAPEVGGETGIEEGRVERHEEMPDLNEGAGLVRGEVDAADIRAAEHARQDFHHHRQAVALVAAERAIAAERGQALRFCMEGGGRIGLGQAVRAHGPTVRQRFARPARDVDLADGDGAGRHVERERLTRCRARGEGDRIGGEARLACARRNHGRCSCRCRQAAGRAPRMVAAPAAPMLDDGCDTPRPLRACPRAPWAIGRECSDAVGLAPGQPRFAERGPSASGRSFRPRAWS